MNKIIFLITCVCYQLLNSVQAQKLNRSDLDKISKEYARKTIDKELVDFLSLPNNADNPEDITKNLEWLAAEFSKRSFETRLISTPGNSVFFAERKAKKAKFTILFYMHFDGQPVDTSKWDQADPYIPVVKKRNPNGSWEEVSWDVLKGDMNPELRVFGRSSSDDKDQSSCFLQHWMDLRRQVLKFHTT